MTPLFFCCLSTGVFGYPNEKAALVAVNQVKKYLQEENKFIKKVVFNVFLDKDYDVYRQLLG